MLKALYMDAAVLFKFQSLHLACVNYLNVNILETKYDSYIST